MGLDKLDAQSMKKVPPILGEVDVLKIALTLPGVQTVGEGANGINVRGGTADQNLMLLDETPIFNPTSRNVCTSPFARPYRNFNI